MGDGLRLFGRAKRGRTPHLAERTRINVGLISLSNLWRKAFPPISAM
jgi:hypothetical protein